MLESVFLLDRGRLVKLPCFQAFHYIIDLY